MTRSLPRMLVPLLAALAWLAAPLAAAPTTAARSSAAVQEGGEGRNGQEEQAKADQDSPRASMDRYLRACRDGEYTRAARFLDLSSLPASERDQEGPQRARQLKVVLDRKVWVDLDAISGVSGGDPDDVEDPALERVLTIEDTSTGDVDLMMRRAHDAGGEAPWIFTASTVSRIPTLYDEFGYGVLGEYLPTTFFEVRVLEIQLWQWVALLLLVIAAYLGSWMITAAVYTAIRPLAARSRSDLDDRLIDLTIKPVRVLVGLGLFTVGIYLLRLVEPAEEGLVGLAKGLLVVVVAWLFLRMVDVLTGLLKSRLERQGKVSAVAALPLGEKTIKVVVLGFAAVAMLDFLGFNVTGLIAGLGVGGLALALAAQKTVENLFGGVSLIMDQPVRVGNFCRFGGDKVGTVEDIGLRTTKIRTLDRTVVSIPNADFAYMQLENFARRDKIRFYTKLGLRYETTPDQMRWVLAEIRKLLLSHSRVLEDPARVRFVGYGAFSLDLEIFAYVDTGDFNEYLGVQEDLLLRLMDIVNSSGTGFAFPSNTTYLARDGGNDDEVTKEVEKQVQAWREEGKLPFPDYAGEFKREIDDTIPYPVKESAVAKG